jgi:hypothetical protein
LSKALKITFNVEADEETILENKEFITEAVLKEIKEQYAKKGIKIDFNGEPNIEIKDEE